MTDLLFSSTPIAEQYSRKDPLIVVGLPRSGSSFLSHIISQIEDWYVFDDLYLQIQPAAIEAKDSPLTEEQMDALLICLGWHVRARVRHGKYAIPNVAEDEVEAMNAAIKQSLMPNGATWYELQEEWMVRLALRKGAAHWGYKLPKAFRNIETLHHHYPNMKLIFLMRQPHDVLSSYKFMEPDSQDGDPNQYHPIAHAAYWRMAAQSYFATLEKGAPPAKLVTFNEIINDPLTAAQSIASFLGSTPPETIDVPTRANTSFSSDARRKEINGLETSVINLLCKSYAERMGFEDRRKPIAFSDFFNLAATTGKFSHYRLKKLFSSEV